jgi:hypothetical protein
MGIQPSCNMRRMVVTVAHLCDYVYPRLPIRQRVLSVPKRMRYYMKLGGAVLNMVLHIDLYPPGRFQPERVYALPCLHC